MHRFPMRWLALCVLLMVLAAAPAGAQEPSATPPLLPNPQLTPGDTLDVTLADIRETGYSSRVRNVPVSVKREVYASYGIQTWGRGMYEVDHLIPLCIGGSNSKKNLWPQSCLTEPWNARVKNRLERRLLSLVRKGTVDLHTAQQDIARNWIEAYKKYVDPGKATAPESSPLLTPAPIPAESKAEQVSDEADMLKDEAADTETTSPSIPAAMASPAASPTAEGGSKLVWVNTRSHVIWKPGGAWYGKTEHGKYMTAAEAEQAGNHYAYGTGR